MDKIGRNAPCPCGSGIKYKKCCLSRHKVAKASSLPKVVPMPPTPPPAPAGTPAVGWFLEEDDLDELSNSVVDLIPQGRLDEAEAVCRDLLKRYPEVPDGLERLAAVNEARGNFQKAADLYRQAAAFIHNEDGFDPGTERFYLDKAEALASRVANHK